MGSPYRLSDVTRKLSRNGCAITPTRSGHMKVVRDVGHARYCYTFPTVKGRKVKDRYISLLRRALHISSEDWESA
jgi:hypothetical protein